MDEDDFIFDIEDVFSMEDSSYEEIDDYLDLEIDEAFDCVD